MLRIVSMSFASALLSDFKTLMKWSELVAKGDILPTVTPVTNTKDLDGCQDSNSGVMFWMRENISYAMKTLTPDSNILDEESKCLENEEIWTNKQELNSVSVVTERKNISTPVQAISFPSFLNRNGYSKRNNFKYRRASLVEGLEKTLDVSFSGQSPILLPVNSTKKKLNNAFKNTFLRTETTLNPKRRDMVHDSLPIPIVDSEFSKASPINLVNIKTIIDSNSTNLGSPPVSRNSTIRSFVGLFAVFLGSCALIGFIYNNFPEMLEEEREKIKLPRDIEDAKSLGRVLSKYKDTYYYEVMSAFFVTYIFLQTFAIPGSVFLSILSGFMYPFYIALFLVCLCSGIGATGCYVISALIGKPLVLRYLEERVRKWNEVVDSQREHLFNYLLFLRITPFLPNWFINIVSPVIDIPVSTFFIATFIGVAPLSFIAIQAGTTLYQLTTAGSALSWTGILVMAILAILSLVPVLMKNRLKGKYE